MRTSSRQIGRNDSTTTTTKNPLNTYSLFTLNNISQISFTLFIFSVDFLCVHSHLILHVSVCFHLNFLYNKREQPISLPWHATLEHLFTEVQYYILLSEQIKCHISTYLFLKRTMQRWLCVDVFVDFSMHFTRSLVILW